MAEKDDIYNVVYNLAYKHNVYSIYTVLHVGQSYLLAVGKAL